MDLSNLSPNQATIGAGGDVIMEFSDWRNQLQRERIVNKIMDTLERHLSFSGIERLQELEKIAERVENEIYNATTSQSEYSRKVCFMMLTMETRLQNPAWSNSLPLDSTAQTGNPTGVGWQEEVYQKIKAMEQLYLIDLFAQTFNLNGEDWQEEVYQKIKAMKDLYLLELNDLHQEVISKLQQYESLPRQSENEQLEKLNVFKNMLEHHVQFLLIPKHGILASYKDKLGTYEKQISNIINSYRRKSAPPLQQAQAQAPTLSPQHMQSLLQSRQTQSQLTQVHSHDQMHPLDSTAHIGNPNGEDWQEEVYQKIKAMKDLYLPELNDLHQKVINLQRYVSLPQQPQYEHLEMIKVFKNMLEGYLQFLQIPKHGISDNYRDNLDSYEKQIISAINSYRRKQARPQQQAQALPPPHVQPL